MYMLIGRAIEFTTPPNLHKWGRDAQIVRPVLLGRGVCHNDIDRTRALLDS